MAVTVERLKVDLAFDTAGLRQGFGMASQGFKQMNEQVSTMKLSFGGLAKSALGALSFNKIFDTVKHAADAGSALVDMSDRTGLSVESLSQFKYAVEQSGASLEDFETGVKKMQKASQGGEGGKIFAQLGLNIQEFKALDPHEQMVMLAESIGKIENPGKKAAVAMEIFGKSGTSLIPLFNDGAEGMQNLMQQAEELGLVMSTKDAKAAEEFGDTLDRIKAVTSRAVTVIGSMLIPALNVAAQSLGTVVSFIRDQFGAATEIAGSAWARFGPYVVSIWDSAWSFIQNAAIAAWGVITSVTSTAVDTWAMYGPYVTELFSSMWSFVQSVTVSTWTAISTAVSTAWGVITSVTSTAWGWLTSLFGGDSMGLKAWAEYFQAALLTISFGFENWQAVVGLAATKVMYWVVAAANEIIFTFTDRIPTYLAWFADNWMNIFKTIGSFTTSVFSGLWTNAKNFFTNLWNWVSSRGKEPFEFTWTSLTESFKNSIKDLPNVVLRQEGDLEMSLRQQAEGLQDSLSKSFDEYVAGKVQKIEMDKTIQPDAFTPLDQPLETPSAQKLYPVDELPSKDKKSSNVENKALERGTVAAYSAEKKSQEQMQVQKSIDKKVGESNRLIAEQNAIARTAQLQPVRIA